MKNKLWFHSYDKGSDDFDFIQAFLLSEGIEFGKFELNALAKEYAKPNTLSDDQRQELLSSFPEISGKYENRQGYRCDIVCLYPEFEHLDFIMDMFGNVHYHFENEYWYFFDGRLGFTFYCRDGIKFSVAVEQGEYIQVPEKIWQQCFFVSPQDRMKSMRFFDTTGTVKLPELNLEEANESC